MSFVELLEAEQAAVRNAMANSDIPFQYLVQNLNIRRTAQYAPLVQAMITYDADCELLLFHLVID